MGGALAGAEKPDASQRVRASGFGFPSDFGFRPSDFARSRRSNSVIKVANLALVALIGLVDYATGFNVSVTLFYLLPVSLGTWFAGRRTGIFMACASAAVWLCADSWGRIGLSHPFVPAWNSITLGCSFVIVACLLGALRDKDARLEQLVSERTAHLQAEIAERVRTEKQLRETNATLTATREELQESFRQLQQAHEELRNTHSQLVEAAKMETVGRLAAGVAHEVKNPLMTLSLAADYFSHRQGDDADESTLIQDMKEAVRRAGNIIDILLDYSRPRPLQRVPTNLNTLIENSLTLVRQQLTKGRVNVCCELLERLPPVSLDRSRIEHVLVNLFINAQQAMPDGGTLTVRSSVTTLTTNGAALPGFVTVEIEDTGNGIEPEHLEKVFDPFFTTKPAGQGTGLGLSIVRKIMETHGGTISLSNRNRGGARAVLKFNLEEKGKL